MNSYEAVGELFLSFVVCILSRGEQVEGGLYVVSRSAIHYEYLSLRSILLLYGCVYTVVSLCDCNGVADRYSKYSSLLITPPYYKNGITQPSLASYKSRYNTMPTPRQACDDYIAARVDRHGLESVYKIQGIQRLLQSVTFFGRYDKGITIETHLLFDLASYVKDRDYASQKGMFYRTRSPICMLCLYAPLCNLDYS